VHEHHKRKIVKNELKNFLKMCLPSLSLFVNTTTTAATTTATTIEKAQW
jgi:hypothetical protein